MSPFTQRTSTAEVITKEATLADSKVGPAESTTATSSDNGQQQQQQQQTPRGGWFHWHEPNTTPAEKRLLFKLDWFLLSFSCLTYFVKQLDQNNVSNAYVSGMEEELGFGPGNELSWMNTYFNIGTILGGTFSNLILTVVRPSYWLPGCLGAWSLFVLGLFRCNTATQFYVLRFFVGLAESAAFPGIMYCLGCWYRRSELARRSSLFVISGVLGQMFSGYLQSALFAGMDGKGGLSAWRWLFIFDFILAVPVAIYGFVSSSALLIFVHRFNRKPYLQHTDNSQFVRSASQTPQKQPAPSTSTPGNAPAPASA